MNFENTDMAFAAGLLKGIEYQNEKDQNEKLYPCDRRTIFINNINLVTNGGQPIPLYFQFQNDCTSSSGTWESSLPFKGTTEVSLRKGQSLGNVRVGFFSPEEGRVKYFTTESFTDAGNDWPLIVASASIPTATRNSIVGTGPYSIKIKHYNSASKLAWSSERNYTDILFDNAPYYVSGSGQYYELTRR